MVRASIYSMQNIVKQIYEENKMVNTESKIVPVSEIFRLQNMDKC